MRIAPYGPHAFLSYRVDSHWWSVSADVRTFRIEEILATKLRALYTRRKGRDLYDPWLTLTELTLDDQLIVDGLAHYSLTASVRNDMCRLYF
jgi:predicted nucleotidyltransferase component of viral defense system